MAEDLTILGIDPGAKCGMAIVSRVNDRLIVREAWTANVEASSLAEAMEEMQDAVYRAVISGGEGDLRVEVIAYEQSNYVRNVKLFRRQAALAGMIELTASGYGLMCIPVVPTAAKKALTGNGRASKQEVLNAARIFLSVENGVRTEDEADAIAVAVAALGMLEVGQ